MSDWPSYFRDESKDLHVMPNDNKHDCSAKCFCEPVVSYEDEITKKRVYVHKSDEEMNQ